MTNENSFQERSEGRNLSESYNWFKDRRVVDEFSETLSQIGEKLLEEVFLLGLGSGQGLVERSFKKKLEAEWDKRVFLVESDRDSRALSKPQGEGVRQVIADNKKLPFQDELFDLIVARSVTHYEATEALEKLVLGEVKRILKEGGFFLNEVPCLATAKEAQLLFQIHNEFVGKTMNLQEKEKVIALHREIFPKVSLARVQPVIGLTVNVRNFQRRYGITNEQRRGIINLIQSFDTETIPNIFVTGDDFGWTVPYMVLVCEK